MPNFYRMAVEFLLSVNNRKLGLDDVDALVELLREAFDRGRLIEVGDSNATRR